MHFRSSATISDYVDRRVDLPEFTEGKEDYKVLWPLTSQKRSSDWKLLSMLSCRLTSWEQRMQLLAYINLQNHFSRLASLLLPSLSLVFPPLSHSLSPPSFSSLTVKWGSDILGSDLFRFTLFFLRIWHLLAGTSAELWLLAWCRNKTSVNPGLSPFCTANARAHIHKFCTSQRRWHTKLFILCALFLHWKVQFWRPSHQKAKSLCLWHQETPMEVCTALLSI